MHACSVRQDSKPAYLVEVEDKVKLADIAEIMVQDFHKKVHTFKVCKFIVSHINTHGEK